MMDLWDMSFKMTIINAFQNAWKNGGIHQGPGLIKKKIQTEILDVENKYPEVKFKI